MGYQTKRFSLRRTVTPLLLCLVVVITSVISLIPARPVSAVRTGGGSGISFSWVNEGTIQVTFNGTQYDFTDPSSIQDYNQQCLTGLFCGPPYQFINNTTCSQSVIWANAASPGTIAHGYINYQPTSNSNCIQHNFVNNAPTVNTVNADIIYRYCGNGSICRIDAPNVYTFIQSSSNKALYVVQHSGGLSCGDTVYVNPSNLYRGALYELDTSNDGKGPPPPNIGATGCFISKYTDDVDGPALNGAQQPSCPPTGFGGGCNICPISFSSSARYCSRWPQNAPNNGFYIHLGGDANKNGQPGGGGGGVQDTCPVTVNWALRWAVCPLLDVIGASVIPLNNALNAMLTTPPAYFNTSTTAGQAFFTARNSIYALAVSLVILAALVMVAAEAAGFEVLNAYSIRKLLPRLLIAAILMTLSWPIMAFISQFFNDIGAWLGDIIVYPFRHAVNANGTSIGPSDVFAALGGAGVLGATIAAIAIGPVDVMVVASLLISLLIALFIAWVTLVMRNMIIVLGVITAPLALAAYILPATQLLWRFWRDTVFGAFALGAIIPLILGAGQDLAAVLLLAGGLMALGAPVAIIASYGLLGTGFRLVGGLQAAFHGKVHSMHGGFRQGLSNFRKKKTAQTWGNMKSGQRWGNTNRFASRLSRVAQGIAVQQDVGMTPNLRKRRERTEYFRGIGEEHAAEQARENDALVKAVGKNDSLMRPVFATAGRRYATEGARRQAVQRSLMDEGLGGFYDGRTGQYVVTNQAELDQRTRQVLDFQKRTGNGRVTRLLAHQSLAAAGTGFKNTEMDVEDVARQGINLNELVEGRDFHYIATKSRELNLAAAQQQGLLNGLTQGQDYDVHGDKVVIKSKDASKLGRVEFHDAAFKARESVANAARDDATGEIDTAIRDNIIGQDKQALTQSGRPEIGSAGYGFTIGKVEQIEEQVLEQPGLSGTERMKRAVKFDRDISADALSGTSAQQAFFTGRPYAAQASARGMRFKLQTALEGLNTAHERLARAANAQDQQAAARAVASSQEQVDVLAAQIQSVRDAQASMPQASGDAIRQNLTSIRLRRIPASGPRVDLATGQHIAAQPERYVIDTEHNGQQTGDVNFVEFVNGRMSSEVYAERKREFDERNRAAANAAGAQAQMGPGGQGMPPAPPGGAYVPPGVGGP